MEYDLTREPDCLIVVADLYDEYVVYKYSTIEKQIFSISKLEKTPESKFTIKLLKMVKKYSWYPREEFKVYFDRRLEQLISKNVELLGWSEDLAIFLARLLKYLKPLLNEISSFDEYVLGVEEMIRISAPQVLEIFEKEIYFQGE